MTSPEGAFYSAIDADSPSPSGHREEGRFFTWTPPEVSAVLGEGRARVIDAFFDVTEPGNFDGRSILHVGRAIEATERTSFEESRELLYQARRKRPPPIRDEKILTSWNALMISAHARAAMVLGDARYVERAVRAADFVLAHLRKERRLLRRFIAGEARHSARLEDHAFLVAALLDLHEATGEARYLSEAIDVDQIVRTHFEDPRGGWFASADDAETLLAREKPSHDGAEPSGSSVHALNLLRLAELTGKEDYRQRAERAFGAFGNLLERSPSNLSEMLIALDFHLAKPKEILLVAPSSRSELDPFLERLRRSFLPNRVLVAVVAGAQHDANMKLVPWLEGKLPKNGKATAFVCERGSCQLPTTDADVFERELR